MTAQKAQISDGHPLEGHYKMRLHKEGAWTLAIIWADRQTGEMVCRVGPDSNAHMVDANEAWLSCAKNKVTKAEAQAYRQDGRWPGDAPLAPEGHNQPPSGDPLEDLQRKLEAEQLRVEAWVGEAHEGQTAANQAANWLVALRKLEGEVLDAFEAEKEPIRKQATTIDTRWRPLKTMAEAIKRAMDERFQAIGRKEKKRLQDIADAKARDEAAKARKEREEEAARMAALATHHGIQLEPQEPVQEVMVLAAPPVKLAYGGAQGSRVGLRKKPATALVEDWAKAAAHYAGNSKVRELIQKLADHDARDGRTSIPGAKIIPGE